MSALPWLIGGVCAGLLGVAVLALVLFGLQDNTPVAEVDEVADRVANSTSVNGRNRGTNRTVAQRDNVRSTRSSKERITPPVDAPDRLNWDRDPDIRDEDVLDVDNLKSSTDSGTEVAAIDRPEPTTEPPVEEPVLRLASAPRAVALPKRTSGDLASIAPVVLTRVNTEDLSEVQLKLPEAALAGGSGRFQLTLRDDKNSSVRTWDVSHSQDGGAPASVGQYTLSDGELSFAWSPDADAQAHSQLENLPLQVTAGDETATIAQREADAAEPIVVKVDAGAIGASISIDNPPEGADVIVSIEDLGEEFGEYTWEPSNAIEVGDTSMLRFGSEEDAFQLALQVSVEEAGPNRLRIETRPMFRQGASKRWDFFRPKETAQALVALQQQQITLDARMQAIQRQFRRDPAARDQATAIHNQQSALLLENIATLERMSGRCLELQDKGLARPLGKRDRAGADQLVRRQAVRRLLHGRA